ncbi:MAG: hypothetical protein ACE5FL_05860 [Myxococcota bacterium]
MKNWILLLAGLILVSNAIPGLAGTANMGPLVDTYVVADPGAPEVTPQNLFLNDFFWPFRVSLKQDYSPTGAEATLPAGPGVLVRVGPKGTARIDFASRGVFDVPIELTDLVESSNRLRRGQETKMAPNLVLTIGNKLIDSTGDRIHVFHLPRNSPISALLCVYVDLTASGFADLAEALSGFEGRSDIEVVVIPQTTLHDLGAWKRFREVGLRAPFVRERYREPFMRSLLPRDHASELPYLQLATKDGRILAEGRFQGRLPAAIERSLDRAGPGVFSHFRVSWGFARFRAVEEICDAALRPFPASRCLHRSRPRRGRFGPGLPARRHVRSAHLRSADLELQLRAGRR